MLQLYKTCRENVVASAFGCAKYRYDSGEFRLSSAAQRGIMRLEKSPTMRDLYNVRVV